MHYTTTTTPLRYNYNYSCTTLHYIQQLWVRWPTRWPLQPLQPLQKIQLQPPFGPSVDSLCHPWFTTTNLSNRFPIFETSATALCGTTGIYIYIYIHLCVYRNIYGIYMYISNVGITKTSLSIFSSALSSRPTSPPHLLDSAVGVEDNLYLFFSNILVIKMTMANMFFYVKQDQKKTKSDNLLKSW